MYHDGCCASEVGSEKYSTNNRGTGYTIQDGADEQHDTDWYYGTVGETELCGAFYGVRFTNYFHNRIKE